MLKKQNVVVPMWAFQNILCSNPEKSHFWC